MLWLHTMLVSLPGSKRQREFISDLLLGRTEPRYASTATRCCRP